MIQDTPFIERIRRLFRRPVKTYWKPGPQKGLIPTPNPRSREATDLAVVRRNATLFEDAMKATTVDRPYYPREDEPPTTEPALLLPGVQIRKVKTNGDRVYISPND